MRFERELRGQLRYRLGLVLQRLIGPRRTADQLDPRDIHSVLIGRINGRLGNTLFLTPLIAQLHELLPEAQIDLALSYPNAPALLAGMPGVRRVILFPHKGANLIAGYLRALRQLRATHYDLCIDPTPFSTSGRLLLSLTRARFRLGFNLPSQWAALTHAVPLSGQTLHQGRQPAYLLTALGAHWDPAALRLRLPLQADEVTAGRAAIAAALASVGADQRPQPTHRRLLRACHGIEGAAAVLVVQVLAGPAGPAPGSHTARVPAGRQGGAHGAGICDAASARTAPADGRDLQPANVRLG